ncbi:MAG: hypothetical protein L3J52_02425 [Proteobacteria bacterium]|nr:hypothetical protein [Pseudomonadota bacterium]
MKFKTLLISVALLFSIHASAFCGGGSSGASANLASAYSNLANALNSGNSAVIANAQLQVRIAITECRQF